MRGPSLREMPTRPLQAARPFLVQQKYEDYTVDQHELWGELVRRRCAQLEQLACDEYWEGFDAIGLGERCVPVLADVSLRLRRRTGWSSTPVSGFMPARAFFEMLSARMFPTTTRLRQREAAEYTPEPDIFHDVFGHVPMHAHQGFADFLQYYGKVCAGLENPDALEKLGRLFWYTVEFGVIRERGEIRLYGSGLISSHEESTNVLEGKVEVRPFDLDEVLETPVKVDQVHQLVFVIESFDQIYEAMERVALLVAEQ